MTRLDGANTGVEEAIEKMRVLLKSMNGLTRFQSWTDMELPG
jgi:hypothetical protein